MMGNQDVTGASPVATGLGAPEGAEPPSRLGATPAIPSAEPPLSKADKEAAREQMVACFRAAISAAYARQVRRGFTIAVMARRLGWKPEKMERLLMVPRDIKLDEIAMVCFAMRCEPEFDTDAATGRILIGVRRWPDDYAERVEGRAASGMEAPSGGETAQTGSTEGDSPTGEAGDAQQQQPPSR